MTCCPHCGKAITPARPGPLTPRQQQLRDVIAAAEAVGKKLTYQQMADGIGAKSKSQVFSLVKRLEDRGHVYRLPGRECGVGLVERAR